MTLKNKLRHLLGRDRFDAELVEEMRIHQEMRAEELEGEGVGREEARARARREFGAAGRIEEEVREVWRWSWLEDLVSDVRYGWRGMVRSPGFAAAAVFSIALGTAANTTVFSVAMEFLFSEPSAREAERIVTMRVGGRSHAEQREWRVVRESGVFEDVAGMREEGSVNWKVGAETLRVPVVRVTENYFELVGAPMAMGRGLRSGTANEAVLSWRFWQSRLGGDAGVVGRVLNLDGRAVTVAGVLPEGHRTLVGFGYAPEMYVGVGDEREPVKLVVRLGEGVSYGEAVERLKGVCGRLDGMWPRAEGARARGVQLEAVTGLGRMTAKMARTVGAFFLMVGLVSGLVLLVACANVASLHLARASARQQELAVRSALGARRGRLVRQMLAESLLLAGLGTGVGVCLNVALTRALNGTPLPLPVPVRLLIAPDWRLFGYALVVAGLSALASGVLPALAATRRMAGLRAGQRGAGGTARFRSVVVVGQLAVTTVLLSAGLLFVRNLAEAGSIDPGFDVRKTVWATVRLAPGGTAEEEAARGRAAQAAVLEAARGVPGVESAALVEVVPLNDGRTMTTTVKAEGAATGERLALRLNNVSPDYFRTMGIGMVAGRDFGAGDRAGSERVAVVSEELARRVFGGNAVGRRMEWETIAGRKDGRLIVGVVRNSKYMTLGEAPATAMYEPVAQGGEAGLSVHVMARTGRPVEDVARELRVALAGVSGGGHAVEARPMKSAMAMAFLPSRAGAALLGTMGALGLLLASLGLYGVLAYAVSRRVREIGVRVALGATPGRVLRLVAGQSLRLVGIGTGLGLAVAAMAMQPLAMFLVEEVSPADPVTYVAVAALLGAIGMAATAGPAMRAIGVAPVEALREE